MTPVVFVHGLMGGSAQWEGQCAALVKHPVVTLDLPGFGAHAHLTPLHSIADLANWALKELDTRAIERFHLIGHSMGGMVAQEMAASAPARIDRLVLYGTGPTGVLPGRFETIATSKERARHDGAMTTARRIAATWFLNTDKAAAYPACAAIAERAGLDAILAGLDAMNTWSGIAHLPHIKIPTLVLWGDNDRTYPWSQTEQLWREIEGASLAVIPSCAHAVHLEKPALFNAVLAEFLGA